MRTRRRSSTGIPLPAGQPSLRVPVDQTLSGLVAQHGEALIEIHAQDRPEHAAVPLRQLGVRTFVCLPLVVAEQVIGTLALAHPDAVPLDDDLIPLAQSLTHVIATLIARHRAESALQVALTDLLIRRYVPSSSQ